MRALLLLCVLASCAHVQNVGAKCEGDIAPLIVPVTAALATADWESAVAQVTIGVLPCLVVATVQEIARSQPKVKASAMVNVQAHARAWLAVHGG